MWSYLVRRGVSAIPVLFLASVAVFMLLRLVPGDPAELLAGSSATAQQVQQTREQLGLTGSPVEQYVRWLGHAASLDFGRSFQYRVPVRTVIGQQLEPTLQLAISAYLFTLVVGIAGGLIAASGRNWNLAANAFTAAAVGVPTFVLGILLLLVFAAEWHILPASGAVSLTSDPLDALRHLVLPTLALGSVTVAVLVRFVGTAMRQVLAEDYIRTARAKGLGNRVVLVRHALRNALIPVVTVSALQVGRLLGGTIVIEQVFTRPGLGRLLVEGIFGRDYLLVQAIILLLVLVFIVVNLAADVAYGLADPRIRT